MLIFSSVISAFAFTYPEGVTEQTAQESAEKTDLLIKNLLQDTSGKTLSALALPMMFSDETLSQMLVSIYSSLEEQSETLGKIGIDISVDAVAKNLSAYPQVQAKLFEAVDWKTANLKGAKWGVKTKLDFANALSSMTAPFNELLYMLLCGGSYKMSIITFRGEHGYQDGIVPALKAFGCTEILSEADFNKAAQQNRNAMVYNIVLSVFSSLEKIFESPAVRLSQVMPNFAHYIKHGGLEKSINALMVPFTPHLKILSSFLTGTKILSLILYIQDSKKFTTDFGENFTTIANDMLASTEFELAEIDLEKLASCGTVSGDSVTANIGEAYTTLFTWLIDTLKLNKDDVMKAVSENGEDSQQIGKIVDTLFAKDTNELFTMLVDLLTKTGGKDLDYQWQTPAFTKTDVTYPTNLGPEKFQRVLDGIDELIGEFIAETYGEKDLTSFLKRTVYSSDVVSTLAVGLYSALSGEEMEMLSSIGLSFSPSAVANELSERQFSSVRSVLYRNSSWKKINPKSLYWGFKDGDKDGFIRAVCAVLRPFDDILRMLLVSDTYELLGAVKLGGSNGYNTAVIPILEALGCPSKSILTYDEFKAKADGDGIAENLLKPITALVDKVAKKPVYTLTEILPNIVFFVSNGSLMQCGKNLLTPIFALLEEFSINVSDLGLDLEKLEKTDILETLATEITKIEDIKLDKPDLKNLGGIGDAQTVTSKATYMGAPVSSVYVKADQTAVIATLLHYLAAQIGKKENAGLIDGMMAGGEGDGGTFAQFSSGIGEQLSSMTTDELLEWLYHLFFRERAVKEEKEVDVNYTTAFTYVPKKENNTKQVVLITLTAVVVLAVVLILNRKRISNYIKTKKEERAEKVIGAEQEI